MPAGQSKPSYNISIQEEVYGSENLIVCLFIPLRLVMVLCFSTGFRTHKG